MAKKIFVSCGFYGRSEEAINEHMKIAHDQIKEIMDNVGITDYELIDNRNCPEPRDNEEVGKGYCLGEAIKKLRDCDMIYIPENWTDFKGCTVEVACAHAYRITKIRAYTRKDGTLVWKLEGGF